MRRLVGLATNRFEKCRLEQQHDREYEYRNHVHEPFQAVVFEPSGVVRDDDRDREQVEQHEQNVIQPRIPRVVLTLAETPMNSMNY